MFTQTQSTHPMQLRKRRRLSEVAYPGFKKVRMVKRITSRDPTECFLFITTMLIFYAVVMGVFYSFMIRTKVLAA